MQETEENNDSVTEENINTNIVEDSSKDQNKDIEKQKINIPASHYEQKDNSRKFKKTMIILVIVIQIILAVFVVKWFLNKDKSSNTNQPQSAQGSQADNSNSTITSKTYKSEDLKIELSHLSSWKAEETTSQINLISPEINYKKKDGVETKSYFRLVIEKGINQNDANAINKSIAVKDSENIAYSAPAEGQRKETFLSFVGSDKETFNFLLISSGKQYIAGDRVQGTLPLGQDSYVIVGGYGKGDDNLSFDNISIDGIEQSKVYDQAVDIIKSLKIY